MSNTFTLKVTLDTDGNVNGEDIAEALSNIASVIEQQSVNYGVIQDSDSNRIGFWEFI